MQLLRSKHFLRLLETEDECAKIIQACYDRENTEVLQLILQLISTSSENMRVSIFKAVLRCDPQDVRTPEVLRIHGFLIRQCRQYARDNQLLGAPEWQEGLEELFKKQDSTLD